MPETVEARSMISRLVAKELGVRPGQVEATVRLLDEGNTIPFIARYRKEATGELDEEQLRAISERVLYLRNLEARKEEVIRLIAEQGALTEELEAKIRAATKLTEVEDLYRPYRPKRRTRATIAREKGLGPLADALLAQDPKSQDVAALAAGFVDPERGVETLEDALAGALDIVAEAISDDAEVRRIVREMTWATGVIVSMADDPQAITEYQMYYDFREPLKKIPPHRILAINRGESQGVLRVSVQADVPAILEAVRRRIIKDECFAASEHLGRACEDAYTRLIAPSIEREIRGDLTSRAEEHAIGIFATNLRNLLLIPPLRGKNVMGIDPGYRTGCKVVVVDDLGRLQDTATIYPHPPQGESEKAITVLSALMRKHRVDVVAIGNGTASRETEALVARMIRTEDFGWDVKYVIVSEAGASVYSASPLARDEFPELDVSMRGAVSIARRLQDPLAELVKIEPKALGVGLYQHDVSQKRLAESLGQVVESCVNYVGVDLNAASPALLSYVAGISKSVAASIVAYRNANGKFTARSELLKVPRLGPATFTQCAGFLRIPEAPNPFDNTAVHPESYELAEKVLAMAGLEASDLATKDGLAEAQKALSRLDPAEVADTLGAGVPTIRDIISALQKPGRDPRDEAPGPVLRSDVLTLEDLKVGMVLTGTVRNVVDFGAFVDIGVKHDGLVHVSELSDRYVRHPTDVVAVGDIVKVRVLSVDLERERVGLSMKGIS